MRNRENMPVYLFTGFLEAGKTRFIQETLEDKRFCKGEKTLLLLCEEGVEEYEPDEFCTKTVEIRTVADPSELTSENLLRLARETDAERVIVEYNGMWMLDLLYQALPEGWMVYQEFFFADARTFLVYNENMRQLVYDKLKSCELAVFNRFTPDMDKMAFHRIVRGASRRCDIAYEAPDGKVEYDDIVDPLPFDVDAPVIEIGDDDYALWYRDLSEELKSYNGKTVHFKAQVATAEELDADTIIVGRQLMNCCAADITFAGVIAVGNTRRDIGDGDWVDLTASIRVKKHPLYTRPGPVLTVKEIAPAEPPEEEVATFY